MDSFWRLLKAWWGFMSCAIWTLLGLWVLAYNPNAKNQLAAYFSLAGFSLLLALLQTIYQQRNELVRLKALPPDIKLTIQMLCCTGREMKNGSGASVTFLFKPPLSCRICQTLKSNLPLSSSFGVKLFS